MVIALYLLLAFGATKPNSPHVWTYRAPGCGIQVSNPQIVSLRFESPGHDCSDVSATFRDRHGTEHILVLELFRGRLEDAPRLSNLGWQYNDGKWAFTYQSVRVQEKKTALWVAEIGEAQTGCSSDSGEHYTEFAYGAIVSDGSQLAVIDGGSCREQDEDGLNMFLDGFRFVAPGTRR